MPLHSGRGERGAVIVETSLSLCLFLFFLFTLLNVTQIAYTQVRVSVALDSVTKQLAEYSHVYYATGLDEVMEQDSGKSSDLANQVAEFLQELGGENLSGTELGSLISGAGDALEGDSISALIRHEVGAALVENMLESALGDNFCQKHNIVDGFNTVQCKFLENGTDIFLMVQYDVQVIQLLNIDYSFHLSSCSYTQAWKGK